MSDKPDPEPQKSKKKLTKKQRNWVQRLSPSEPSDDGAPLIPELFIQSDDDDATKAQKLKELNRQNAQDQRLKKDGALDKGLDAVGQVAGLGIGKVQDAVSNSMTSGPRKGRLGPGAMAQKKVGEIFVLLGDCVGLVDPIGVSAGLGVIGGAMQDKAVGMTKKQVAARGGVAGAGSAIPLTHMAKSWTSITADARKVCKNPQQQSIFDAIAAERQEITEVSELIQKMESHQVSEEHYKDVIARLAKLEKKLRRWQGQLRKREDKGKRGLLKNHPGAAASDEWVDDAQSEPESEDEEQQESMAQPQRDAYLREIRAAALLQHNNCLINAISDAADVNRATEEQLVVIRAELGNVGEMMRANNNTIGVIRRVLRVRRPVTVYNAGQDYPEDFEGRGAEIAVTNNGDEHFVAGAPWDNR